VKKKRSRKGKKDCQGRATISVKIVETEKESNNTIMKGHVIEQE
jgi:hypothetical protein